MDLVQVWTRLGCIKILYWKHRTIIIINGSGMAHPSVPLVHLQAGPIKTDMAAEIGC